MTQIRFTLTGGGGKTNNTYTGGGGELKLSSIEKMGVEAALENCEGL